MKDTAFFFILFFLLFSSLGTIAQNDHRLPKVSHAEPIYFDLIRDLGARKGERELNVGMGMSSAVSGAEHSYLVEYEFAPLNRLGLEVEVPLSFRRTKDEDSEEEPENGVEGIKAAMQYSFFVSEKWRTTMAVGYIFERRLSRIHPGHEHMPFFIVAKRWGNQFHTMLFTGPAYSYENQNMKRSTMINASIHYMLPSTRNFIGVEINDEVRRHHSEMIVRPQVKMALSSSSSLGISLGISCDQSDKTMDFLVRWIYELKRKS